MRILAIAAACTMLCAGCATVTRGTTQSWTVQTDPVGATARLSSGEQCTTPCTLQKKRKDPFQVTITKDGYDQVVTSIVSRVSSAGKAGMAGNVIIGGLIGVGVDASSGATKDLVPNPLVVKMAPAGSGQEAMTNAMDPDVPKTPLIGGSNHMTHYRDAAMSELAKRQCVGDFRYVGDAAGGEEEYRGLCADKRVQSVQCDAVACRPAN